MPRADEPHVGVEVLLYRCSVPHCGRVEDRRQPPAGAGTADDSARVAGWHVGYREAPQGQGRTRVTHCPACMGHDRGYWARRDGEPAGVPQLPSGSGAGQ
jgi:hypothetical protein